MKSFGHLALLSMLVDDNHMYGIGHIVLVSDLMFNFQACSDLNMKLLYSGIPLKLNVYTFESKKIF